MCLFTGNVSYPPSYLPARVYIGIVKSNQHLVVCDSGFNVPTPPYSWIRIPFMRSLSPLSTFKSWCTFRSTHR